jgi:hypothetical protein
MLKSVSLLAAIALTACATVAHGPHETLIIESTPDGASVELRCDSLVRHAVTPTKITIPRRATDCALRVTKEGYAPADAIAQRGPSPWYWMNFIGVAMLPLGLSDGSPVSVSGDTGLAMIAGGIGGLILDAADGAMWRHKPDRFRIRLTPLVPGRPGRPPT